MVEDVMYQDSCIDLNEWQQSQFQSLKTNHFDKNVFRWYILVNKDTEDFELFMNILEGKQLDETYHKICKNIRKRGQIEQPYEELVTLYISKRFNQHILKPMCKYALKGDFKRVRKIATFEFC